MAARTREEGKWATYHDRYGEQGAPGVRFVPFVVEATGRIGPQGLQFFNTMFGDEFWDQKEDFLHKMSAEIARWNSRMVQTARSRLQPVQANGARRGGGE